MMSGETYLLKTSEVYVSVCVCAGPRYERMFRAAERKETVANLQAVQSLVRWDSLRYIQTVAYDTQLNVNR